MHFLHGERISQGHPLRLAAVGAVFDPAGRILLTKRADNGLWCLPGGGLDSGESLAETCLREIREETGLSVEIVRLVGLYSNPHTIVVYKDGNSWQVVRAFFLCRLISGELTLDAENTAIDWFETKPETLPPLIETHYELISDVLSGQESAFVK